MKLLHIIALTLCLNAPIIHTVGPLTQAVAAANSPAFIDQFTKMSNKGACVVVGVAAAICSCLMAKKGFEEACDKESTNVQGGMTLAAIGVISLALSVVLATR